MKILPFNYISKPTVKKQLQFRSQNIQQDVNGSLNELKADRDILFGLIDQFEKQPENSAEREKIVAQSLNVYEDLNAKIQKARQILDIKRTEEAEDDEKIIEAFFAEMARLSQTKGFNRISGYDDIKAQLETDFILKTMLREKTSMGAKIPNAFLFFGPAGCGKSTFAKAVAEQSLSNIEIIMPEAKEPQEVFDDILQKAQKAKENYENSEDKRRTIILIDEFDCLGYEDSPIIEQLKDFMKTCADEYKCTLFLTTNYPLDLDKEILSKDITPRKIAVPPADIETAKKIMEDYFKKRNKPVMMTANLLDEMFKGMARYSNKDIIDLLDLAFLKTEFPEEEDFIAQLKRRKIVPCLNRRVLEKFEEEKEFFNLD